MRTIFSPYAGTCPSGQTGLITQWVDKTWKVRSLLPQSARELRDTAMVVMFCNGGKIVSSNESEIKPDNGNIHVTPDELHKLNATIESIFFRVRILNAINDCRHHPTSTDLTVLSSKAWYRDQVKQHLADIRNDIDQVLNKKEANK